MMKERTGFAENQNERVTMAKTSTNANANANASAGASASSRAINPTDAGQNNSLVYEHDALGYGFYRVITTI